MPATTTSPSRPKPVRSPPLAITARPTRAPRAIRPSSARNEGGWARPRAAALPLRVEGIEAAIGDVARWRPALDDERQILQRLLLPRRHVREDIFHRPIARDAGFHQLRF